MEQSQRRARLALASADPYEEVTVSSGHNRHDITHVCVLGDWAVCCDPTERVSDLRSAETSWPMGGEHTSRNELAPLRHARSVRAKVRLRYDTSPDPRRDLG